MSLSQKKTRNISLNILIVLLVLLLFILIDLFIVSLRSGTGEDKSETIRGEESLLGNLFGGNENEAVEFEPEQEFNLQEINTEEKVFVPILDFHHIDSAPAGVSKVTKTYYIEPAEFEEILQSLIDDGYQTVFVTQIIEWLEQGVLPQEKIIALTFDDGNTNFQTNAWPILQKLNLKSSIYIMTGVGGENYLSDEQIKELAETDLVEVGSHTIYHPKLTKVAKSKRLKELEASKDELEGLLGYDINVLAYPFGLYNEDVKALTKAVGYKAGLTYDQDAWHDPQDLFELNRISIYPSMNVVKFLDRIKNE